MLRLVVETGSGLEVRPVELVSGERGVLVVIGASPFTDEPACYRVKFSNP